jgi:hypothetical protein
VSFGAAPAGSACTTCLSAGFGVIRPSGGWCSDHRFPSLDPNRDVMHAQLIASVAVAAVLIVATRGRLGRRPDPASPLPHVHQPAPDDLRQADAPGPISPV